MGNSVQAASGLPSLETFPEEPLGEHPTPSAAAKALRILRAFFRSSGELGLSELSRRSGLSKATTYRLLLELEREGFVQRSSTKYQLGAVLFELGNRVPFARPDRLLDAARPEMLAVHASTRLTTKLGVLADCEVLVIERFQSPDYRGRSRPGLRLPPNCSSLGKCLIAHCGSREVQEVIERGLVRRTRFSIVEPARFVHELVRIRERGVAVSAEEGRLGIVSVAAPVSHEGHIAAAVSISGRAEQARVPVLERHALDLARRIQRAVDAAPRC